MTDLMIVGSLAASAVLSWSFATGSLAVTRSKRGVSEETTTPDERRAAMRAINPAFIARNHLVEEAISAAMGTGDFAPFEELVAVLATPFEDQPRHARLAEPPRPDQIVEQTFCGT